MYLSELIDCGWGSVLNVGDFDLGFRMFWFPIAIFGLQMEANVVCWSFWNAKIFEPPNHFPATSTVTRMTGQCLVDGKVTTGHPEDSRTWRVQT